MEIGFIGLGHMGQAIARNLLKTGHRVTVHNRTRAKSEDAMLYVDRSTRLPQSARVIQ